MILTVDIGNSRIKWAAWQAEKIVARGVMTHASEINTAMLDELFSTLGPPESVYAVCVAGDDLSQGLSEWVKQRWHLDVEFLKTEKQFDNIINAYEDPGQHGVDRWAAVVAAHQNHPGFSICIISAGTATTFDFINKDGQHLGGYILPSYATMHQALLAGTANVDSMTDMQFNENSVPGNTSDAVNQGLHRFLRSGIRDMCQLAEQKMEAPVQIIISGGFAENILSYPDMPAMKHEPDLVMQGLYNIMKQRKS